MRVLNSLEARNFVRYSEAALRQVGCVLRNTSANQDSQLSTLIHEVTHFNDCFGSSDAIYFLRSSRMAAAASDERVKTNADSIAGYVVGDEVFHAD